MSNPVSLFPPDRTMARKPFLVRLLNKFTNHVRSVWRTDPPRPQVVKLLEKLRIELDLQGIEFGFVSHDDHYAMKRL